MFVSSFRFTRALAAASACVLLTACAGGGGGGGPAPSNPPPSGPSGPSRPATNPSLPLNPPSAGSTEYQRNYGLQAIRADVAYGLGATGKGVTVAVLDTGFDLAGQDMQGAYSPDSVDIVTARNALPGVDRHGSRVAGVLASRFNSLGTIGVAYESTVLGIRADNTAPGKGCDNVCWFDAADLGRGVDYAVAKGAKVVNISLAGFDTDAARSAAFEAALDRAVAAGLVFTVAAGNAGEDVPALHARYAADPRYAGAFLAIGATGPDGDMVGFSNRAGATRQSYLTAPGKDVATDCDAAGVCESASGTSFAAPHVAGALAMLLQYFPNLSARDAAAILLRTADDKGDAGTDAIYGRGALNLAKAFEPVGAQSLSLADGTVVDLPGADLGSMLGSAFGDAVSSSEGLTTVVHDDYDRLFAVDLAQGYARRQRSSLFGEPAPPVSEAGETFPLPTGGFLTLAAQTPMFEPAEEDASPLRAFLKPAPATSAMASVRLGAPDNSFTLSAWRGQGQAAAPEGLAGRNAFTRMAAPDRTVSAAWRLGAFAFGSEGGWAERRTLFSIAPQDAGAYASASAAYAGRNFTLSLTGGAMSEPRGALGSELAPASPLSLAARTRFAAVGLDKKLGALMLRAEASLGRTEGGGALVGLDSAVSSAWRLALDGRGFGVELTQPLRVERGAFRALLADMPAAYDDPLSFSVRRFDAAPTAREVDLRLHLDAPLGAGTVRLLAGAAFNPGHQAGEAELAAFTAWRTRF